MSDALTENRFTTHGFAVRGGKAWRGPAADGTRKATRSRRTAKRTDCVIVWESNSGTTCEKWVLRTKTGEKAPLLRRGWPTAGGSGRQRCAKPPQTLRFCRPLPPAAACSACRSRSRCSHRTAPLLDDNLYSQAAATPKGELVPASAFPQTSFRRGDGGAARQRSFAHPGPRQRQPRRARAARRPCRPYHDRTRPQHARPGRAPVRSRQRENRTGQTGRRFVEWRDD